MDETLQKAVDMAVLAAVAPIIVIDREHRIWKASPAATLMFRGQLEGRSVHDLVPEAFRARHRELISEFIASPSSRGMLGQRRVLDVAALDGTPLKLDIQLGAPPEGSELGAVAFLYDLTVWVDAERKAAELSHAKTEAEGQIRVLGLELQAANARSESEGRTGILRLALAATLVVFLGAGVVALSVGSENAVDQFREIAILVVTSIGQLASGYALVKMNNTNKGGTQ